MRETLLLPICVLLLLCLCCGRTEQHRQQDISAAINSGVLQAHSRLDPWGPPNYGPDYFAFSNVQLAGGELIFHTDSSKSANGGAHPPPAIPLNLHESVLQLPVTQVPYGSEQAGPCKGVVSKPAVLIAGTFWDSNFYEMTVNNVMPLWATAVAENLTQADRYLDAEGPPGVAEAGFVLVQARDAAYSSPWSYWFDYLTPHQALMDEMDGFCFTRLVVVMTSILRFIHPRDFATAEDKRAFQEEQQMYLQDFQKWLFRVEDLHQRAQGLPPLPVLQDSVDYSRPRVTFSSRPVRAGRQSRGILNEAEVVQFIQERYDVNVTLVDFQGPVEAAMQLVRQSDMLLGMHGAGLTHVLWLRPGSHFLQLAPYGFSPDGTTLIRGQYFEEAAAAAGATTSHWLNPHPHKATFYREHFDEADGDFFEHPDASTPTPVDWNAPRFWVYQSTEVDLVSFGAALDHAMRKINVPKRKRIS